MKKTILWLKNNFFSVVILFFAAIIILQRCESKVDDFPKPTVVRDTVWATIQDVTISNPTLIKTIPGKPDSVYTPDPNYDKLVKQYQKLVEDYIASNIHKDSIKIDSIGYISITDTITKNKLAGRKTSYNFKYPIITNTITLPSVAKTQLYFGGGIENKPMTGTTELNLGLLLKNKKDQIYNIYGGVDTRGDYQIGVQSYWKIKLGK